MTFNIVSTEEKIGAEFFEEWKLVAEPEPVDGAAILTARKATDEEEVKHDDRSRTRQSLARP